MVAAITVVCRTFVGIQQTGSGPGEEPAPSQAEVQTELDASIAYYRRLLAQERNVPSGPAL